MQLDLAVEELLGLDPARTTVSAKGHGCSSASTVKIAAKLSDGSEKCFFMKTAAGTEGRVMVQGEHSSLQAINSVVPTLCPPSFGWGASKSSPSTSFLVIDFLQSEHSTFFVIDFLMSSLRPPSRQSLAVKLAKLHSTPTPIPEGYSKPQFGFPVTTCCGDTPQENSYKESWAEFYAENRLKFILKRGEANHGEDLELRKLVEAVVTTIVPRLLKDGHLNKGKGITPALVHGDLWFGNAGRGSFGGREVEEVIFDPSACYAHSEYELGIMKMFGGFGRGFFLEYHKLCPKTEPVGEYDDRIALYELYHHLNHYALFGNGNRFAFFGGGYKSSAVRIMKKLLQKYCS